MSEYSPYRPELLPAGFAYPPVFLAMASNAVAAPEPWLFIDATSTVGELLYSLRRADGRNLVPFASLETGDGDTACFDGDDTSGNPAVLMLILDKSGRSYAFKDFSHWLTCAKRDALDWRAGG